MSFHYHVSHNLAGYLPEWVQCIETYDNAIRALKDDMKDYADINDEMAIAGIYETVPEYEQESAIEEVSMKATVDSIIADGDIDAIPSKTTGYAFRVSDNDDQNIDFCITPVDETQCDHSLCEDCYETNGES